MIEQEAELLEPLERGGGKAVQVRMVAVLLCTGALLRDAVAVTCRQQQGDRRPSMILTHAVAYDLVLCTRTLNDIVSERDHAALVGRYMSARTLVLCADV